MHFKLGTASIATLFLAACAGYDADAVPDPDSVGTATSALTGDGTIPRVPNPPLAADLAVLPGDLRAIAVPTPSTLSEYVKDNGAAVRLGKALFWDMQVGTDGVQACASCHFRAGADPRSKNQLSPGLNHVPRDLTFKKGGPNYQLTSSDFPLSRLATPGVRGALDPLTDNNDTVSSQGVHLPGREDDPLGFNVRGANTRRVEPRNTPSVFNAVFNHRQFWDGRAENVFNGVNHLGERDPSARVYRSNDRNAAPVPVAVAITNASLASQAVAPIVSELEMSRPGTSTQDIARQLLRHAHRMGSRVEGARPLAGQKVSPTDSVLGGLSRFPRNGLTVTSYNEMIEAAFKDVWWDSTKLIRIDAAGNVTVVDARERNRCPHDVEQYTLMEYNFGLFFGLAIQMYEATLVSDDTPWDRFRRNHPTAGDPALNPWTNTNPDNISRLALFGAHLFNDRTRGPTNIRCSNCHESAELTDNSVRRVTAAVNGPVRNRDGNIIDKGFNNIGLRPTDNDLGNGASDAFGFLSKTRRLFPGPAPVGTTFDGAVVTKGFGNDGAFKIPSLRNVALTAPYFHNGDMLTLRQTVEFYSRGGNVAPVLAQDGTVIEPLGVPNLTSDEIDALVAFLESLTDERVLYRRAPFDHPQLFVPNGHVGDTRRVRSNRGLAVDRMLEIGATGAAGGAPIPGFLEPGPFSSAAGCDDD